MHQLITISETSYNSSVYFLKTVPAKIAIQDIEMVQNIEAKQFPNEGQQHIENVRITQPQQREIPCINDITHDRADWHKELLFGLFLSCDEKELQSLKSKAGANFGVASARPNSRKIFKERYVCFDEDSNFYIQGWLFFIQ